MELGFRVWCAVAPVPGLEPRTLYMEGKHSVSELDTVPEELSLLDLRSLWELYAPRAHAKESGHFLDPRVQQAATAAVAESHGSGGSNNRILFHTSGGWKAKICSDVREWRFSSVSLCSRWLASVFLFSFSFLRCCPNSIFSQICLLFWIVAHYHDPIFNLITHSRSFLIESQSKVLEVKFQSMNSLLLLFVVLELNLGPLAC